MDIKVTYDLFKRFEHDKHCFIYQGVFRDEITNMITDLTENIIDIDGSFAKLRNRVSFLMVESFQNIIRHSDESEYASKMKKVGLFLIRNIGSVYYITSANIIDSSKVPFLTDKLQKVNELDQDALKSLYKEVLSNNEISQKGGAGLGLIEMARRSGQKLDFDFVKFDDKRSFFYLQLKIKNKKAVAEETEVVQVGETKVFHEVTSRNNIFMVHKGNFSQEAIKPMLRMVENNMMSNKQEKQKVAFHVLVEILQNIARHSYQSQNQREGIFIMGEEDQHYIINVGNIIRNEKVEELGGQLGALNNMDRDQLDKVYLKVLREGRVTENGGAGLGLIDIARESCEKLDFEFTPISDTLSFFSLSVKL